MKKQMIRIAMLISLFVAGTPSAYATNSNCGAMAGGTPFDSVKMTRANTKASTPPPGTGSVSASGEINQ